MRYSLLLCMLTFCGIISAQEQLRQRIGDKFDEAAKGRTNVGHVKIDSILETKKTITVYAGANSSYIPYREDNVQMLYSTIDSMFPATKHKRRLSLLAEGMPIEQYIPIAYRTGKIREKTFRTRNGKPLTIDLSLPMKPGKGLYGRHIAMWQSHGRYYEQRLDRWEWQRARIFQTVEDLYTQSYVLPFLVPMLERAGAHVLMPRERDANPIEVVVDGETPNSSKFYTDDARSAWHQGEGTGFAHLHEVYVDSMNPFTEGRYMEAGTVRSEADQSIASWVPL